MLNDIERVLISAEEIENSVAEIGRKISEDFRDKDPIFVGVLKGCFIFMADLMRHVDIKCSMDFMAVSSYSGTSSTGAVKINKDLSEDIEGRHVIIVEVSPKATYDAYFQMQNAVVAGYNNLRNELAIKQFHHPYSQCNAEQRDAIALVYPQRISEQTLEEKGGES